MYIGLSHILNVKIQSQRIIFTVSLKRIDVIL